MITFPNAKINIGLQVTEKRSDGFHEITSCFYPVPWNDALEIIKSDHTTFNSSGISIPGDKNDNLCLKAYKLLAKDFDLSPVTIHLHKVIPIGAGLGGGSSDASHTLKLLNQLFNLKLSTNQLQQYARQLGSDCAFFIENTPVIATGKGDEFSATPLSLKGYHLLLIYPNLHIPTTEAYSSITPRKPSANIQKTLEKSPPSSWKDAIKNDFEAPLFENHPVLHEIKSKLYKKGALYASMTGSGSTMFGIFEHKPTWENHEGHSTFYAAL